MQRGSHLPFVQFSESISRAAKLTATTLFCSDAPVPLRPTITRSRPSARRTPWPPEHPRRSRRSSRTACRGTRSKSPRVTARLRRRTSRESGRVSEQGGAQQERSSEEHHLCPAVRSLSFARASSLRIGNRFVACPEGQSIPCFVYVFREAYAFEPWLA